LRRAGFEGEFMYWKWHAAWRAWLLVPLIADRNYLEVRATKLAGFIAERRRERPEAPLHLVGYSAGGFIAQRALELLSRDVDVDSAVLIAAAFDPRRDLNPGAGRVRKNLVVTSSPLDAIVGLGSVLIGTCDRIHCRSLGCRGYRGPQCDCLVELRWRPGLVLLGNFGGHFTAPAERFVQRKIAPLMGIGA
jgi:pimeloyl-ACP methyl ester carboxylesterase